MNLATWRIYRATGSPRLRNKLVTENIGIVHKVVRVFAKGPDYDDLVQAGSIGLLLAIDRFNPDHGGFYGYAKFCIFYEVQKAYRHARGQAHSSKLALADAWDIADALHNTADVVSRHSVTSAICPNVGFDAADARHDLALVLQEESPEVRAAMLAAADGSTSAELAKLLGLRGMDARERAVQIVGEAYERARKAMHDAA